MASEFKRIVSDARKNFGQRQAVDSNTHQSDFLWAFLCVLRPPMVNLTPDNHSPQRHREHRGCTERIILLRDEEFHAQRYHKLRGSDLTQATRLAILPRAGPT